MIDTLGKMMKHLLSIVVEVLPILSSIIVVKFSKTRLYRQKIFVAAKHFKIFTRNK